MLVNVFFSKVVLYLFIYRVIFFFWIRGGERRGRRVFVFSMNVSFFDGGGEGGFGK